MVHNKEGHALGSTDEAWMAVAIGYMRGGESRFERPVRRQSGRQGDTPPVHTIAAAA